MCPLRFSSQLLIFLALSLSTTAAVGAAVPLEARSCSPPNHLEPISQSLDAYDEVLQQRLLPLYGDYGTFLFRPSFEGEMGVAISGANYTAGSPREARSFRITVMRATKSLWYSMADKNDPRTAKTVHIVRTDIAIDHDLAVAIQRAWATMLLRTRYPAGKYRGLDGFTAQFSVFVRGMGQLYGETWSPDRGLPKEFVDLGFAVAQYASAAPSARPELRTKLIKRLQSFERRARNA